MKSAREQADEAQRKLSKLLGRAHPLFPAAYEKSVQKTKQQLEFWLALAKQQEQAAMTGFGKATGLDALVGPKPVAQAPGIVTLTPPAPQASVLSSPYVIGGLVILAVASAVSILKR